MDQKYFELAEKRFTDEPFSVVTYFDEDEGK